MGTGSTTVSTISILFLEQRKKTTKNFPQFLFCNYMKEKAERKERRSDIWCILAALVFGLLTKD
jgi:hypothetical protein